MTKGFKDSNARQQRHDAMVVESNDKARREAPRLPGVNLILLAGAT
jgi:hypothetical protein